VSKSALHICPKIYLLEKGLKDVGPKKKGLVSLLSETKQSNIKLRSEQEFHSERTSILIALI
jgi:hypothetical protein